MVLYSWYVPMGSIAATLQRQGRVMELGAKHEDSNTPPLLQYWLGKGVFPVALRIRVLQVTYGKKWLLPISMISTSLIDCQGHHYHGSQPTKNDLYFLKYNHFYLVSTRCTIWFRLVNIQSGPHIIRSAPVIIRSR